MRMRNILFAGVVLVLPLVGFANQAGAAACNGQMVTRIGPNGKTLTICLDGLYSTGLRDARCLGWPESNVQSYCGKRKADGRLR